MRNRLNTKGPSPTQVAINSFYKLRAGEDVKNRMMRFQSFVSIEFHAKRTTVYSLCVLCVDGPLSVIQRCKYAIPVGLMCCRINSSEWEWWIYRRIRCQTQSNAKFFFFSLFFFLFYGQRTRIELIIMVRAFTSSNSIESVEAIKSNWFDWMAAGENMNVLNCKTIHMQRQFNSIKCVRAVGGRESESCGTFIFILIEIVYVRYRRRDGKRYNYIFGQCRMTTAIAAHDMRALTIHHTPQSI